MKSLIDSRLTFFTFGIIAALLLLTIPKLSQRVFFSDYDVPQPRQGFSFQVAHGLKRSDISNVIAVVRKHGWSYMGETALQMHSSLIASISHLKGIMVETGVNEGGSAMVAAATKPSTRELHLYDTFTGIPKPGEKDEKDVYQVYQGIQLGKHGGAIKDGHNGTLLESLKKRFTDLGLEPESNNIHFHPGLFQDTLHVTSDVVYAHLDGDWYDSTMTSLTRVVPHVVKGGYIVVDDYFTWSGCWKAVNDFFGVSNEDTGISSVARPVVVQRFDRQWSMSKRNRRLVIHVMT